MADERDETGEVSPKPKPTTLRLATQDGRFLDEKERREGGGGPPGGGSGAGGDKDEIPTFASEEAMANVLIRERFNGDWRYGSDGSWYHYNGQRWVADATLRVLYLARLVCRSTSAKCTSANVARNVSSSRSISGVERVARADVDVGTAMELFDRDPWKLNCPAGLVDLNTGELSPHDREKLCRMLAGASPMPMHECKNWKRFLKDITGGDQVYEDYLQRLVGYSLCGTRREEIFVFIYGPSNTGKSKFIETWRMLLGDYGATASMNIFMVQQYNQREVELALAGLVGKRLVTAAETAEGRRWDQQILTSLTGRDRVQGRAHYEMAFDYTPQFLLGFHGNYRPKLSGVSDAMQRRLHLLPFKHKPLHIDKFLIDKFRVELPGIMAWAVEGCINWQREGLSPPPIVTSATDDYFEFEDTIGEWIAERCDLDPALYVGSRVLHKDFSGWMQGRGFIPNERDFVSRLEGVDGLKRSAKLPNGARGFHGIALKRRQDEFRLDGEPPFPPTSDG